ncbi:MAG TPA: anti-sigma factor [Verrucomicrobiae bacterium]|nr:anti-sigma factor [Verrucomicrobiae bacterium]
MIDERMEEQASLYVLGVLTREEAYAVETALKQDAKLQQLVSALQISRDALAGSLPQITPPLALRQRVLEQVKAPEKIVKFSPRTEESSGGWAIWLPWALAACLAIVCAISLSQQKGLRQKIDAQAKQLTELDQMADALRDQTQNLKQAVATLQETNRLASLRIAMLNSMLEDSPKAVAVSLWDEQQQRGVFLVQNLKPLPADKDYQLWVIDPKYPTPVSAGVFQVDAQGNVRLQFKTDKLIETADKFAVTQEPKGGLPVPTLKNLVLIGG